MWMLNFLPDWVFHTLLVVGVVGVVLSYAATIVPLLNVHKIAVRCASVGILIVALWFEGGIANDERWRQKVNDLEHQVKIIEAESAKENTKVETRTIRKIEIVKQRGDDIIQYVDREVVKYDQTCIIPREFITAHNRAAERVE